MEKIKVGHEKFDELESSTIKELQASKDQILSKLSSEDRHELELIENALTDMKDRQRLREQK